MTFEEKEKYKTWFGISVSLLINLACLSLLIVFGIELFQGKKPEVNTVNVRSNSAKRTQLNSLDLFFAVNILQENYAPITDPSVIQIVPYYVFSNHTIEGYSGYAIPLIPANCTKFLDTYKETGIEKDFYANGLQNAYCWESQSNLKPLFNVGGYDLDSGKYTNVTIGGRFGTDFYGNLDIAVKKCQNSTTSSIICKPKEEIDAVIHNGYVQSFFINRFVDSNDYEAPIKHFLDSNFVTIDPKMKKLMNNYFNEIEVDTDDGLVLSSNKKESILKNEYMNIDPKFLAPDNYIADIFVITSLNKNIFFRKYMKIQSLAANIVAIQKVLVLVAITIISPFTSAKMEEVIMNKIFTFVKTKKRKSDSGVQLEKKDNTAIISYSDQFSMSYSEIARSKFCFCLKGAKLKKKEKLFQAAKKEMKKYMDFTELIKSLQDIIKMKTINFNENQQKLFEKVKLEFLVSENETSELPFIFAKNVSPTRTDFEEALEECKKEPNEINLKLLEYLHQNNRPLPNNNFIEIKELK